MQQMKDFRNETLTRKYHHLKEVFEEVLNKFCDEQERLRWLELAEIPILACNISKQSEVIEGKSHDDFIGVYEVGQCA